MSNVQPIPMPKINYASSMITEDHLKKCIAKTDGKTWKFSQNKLLPKSQHSCFGDFPKDYMPKKEATLMPVPDIAAAEQSIAAQGKATLKKGQGVGGKTSSLNKAKEVPTV